MVYRTHCFERKYSSLLLKQKVISCLIWLSLDSLNSKKKKNYSIPLQLLLQLRWGRKEKFLLQFHPGFPINLNAQVNSNTAYFCSCVPCSNQLKLSQRLHCHPPCSAHSDSPRITMHPIFAFSSSTPREEGRRGWLYHWQLNFPPTTSLSVVSICFPLFLGELRHHLTGR